MNGKNSRSNKTRACNQAYGDYLTYQGAADFLKKTKNAVKQLVKNGRLTPVKIGNINYLHINDLLNFKSYGRVSKSDPFSELGDISDNSYDCHSKKESDPFAEQGDILSIIDKFIESRFSLEYPAFWKRNIFSGSYFRIDKVESDPFSEQEDILSENCINSFDNNSPRPSLSQDFTRFNSANNSIKTIIAPQDIPLTVSQAAQKLEISTRFVIKKIHQGKIKAKRVGNSWLISASECEAQVATEEQRRKEERDCQEKSTAYEKYKEEFRQLPYTDKILTNLFLSGSQWQKDSIKESIAEFLRGSDLSGIHVPEYEGIEIAKLLEGANQYGISAMLPAGINLSKLVVSMKKRIRHLCAGSYLKRYLKHNEKSSYILSIIQLATNRLNYYQEILNKIQDLQTQNDISIN